MNDVPLIQKADINSINTSIIAIKKQLKQLTEAVGLIDVPDMPDLSPFVKKTDVSDVVEADNMNPVTSNAVAEYTVDEVTSGNMHSVSSNAVAVSGSYSTTEQKTGGVWIDGKPIYRKVFNVGSMSSSSSAQNYAHNISSLDRILSYNGFCEINNAKRNFPYIGRTSVCAIDSYDNTNLKLILDYYVTNLVFAIEYTKTTD